MIKYLISLLIGISFLSCKENKNEIKVLHNIEDAIIYVEKFQNKEEVLFISDDLNDGMGLNMAIICDGILKKSYMPNGFEQKEGYRIYKYVKED